MTIRKCSLCDRTESTHKISQVGVCSTCTVSIIYWRKKSTTKIIARARQIDSFHNRMELLLGNVKRLPAKRRKTA
jgi:hypothetical protein